MGLSRTETLQSRYGEFMDLMACESISNGDAKYKRPRVRMTTEQLLRIK